MTIVREKTVEGGTRPPQMSSDGYYTEQVHGPMEYLDPGNFELASGFVLPEARLASRPSARSTNRRATGSCSRTCTPGPPPL